MFRLLWPKFALGPPTWPPVAFVLATLAATRSVRSSYSKPGTGRKNFLDSKEDDAPAGIADGEDVLPKTWSSG